MPLAKGGWNTRDTGKVALACAIDSRWRNGSEFINGRNEIIAFFSRKSAKELDYRLIKELWTFVHREAHRGTLRLRVARRLGHRYIAPMAMENWEFNDDGLISWPYDLRQSTTFPFWNQNVNITGRGGTGFDEIMLYFGDALWFQIRMVTLFLRTTR